MSTGTLLIWVVLPYLSIVLLVGGHIWRYRTDQFGWTSRSSQWNEPAVLRWASPLFHFGMLFVFLGHVIGLAVPQSWTVAAGVSEDVYHYISMIPGTLAALAALIGMGGLIYRRVVVKSVRLATTPADIVMYILLGVAVALGSWATVHQQIIGGGYDYRQTISPWFRSIPVLHPDPGLMTSVPLDYKMHIIAAMILFCVWPFTRLVHVVSAPVGYTTRPYIVYRSRDEELAAGPRPRGW
ncbi:MAG: respiratory nitrate reductase subunit gamma [Acidipropionibacterium sp.]|jgi:nitrate reductase gamma subunit|nr:respiratory nitrate reductase subunit gamma [Acidipropionibacterium sp.]